MIYEHVAGRLSGLDEEIVKSVPPGGNWRSLPDDFPSKRVQQIRHGAANGGGSRSTYYGRLMWDRPSYTVSTFFNRPGNGCFIHPAAPRLITVREAARLQGFPDRYRFKGTGRTLCSQVGNAVPPLLAYQIGRLVPPGSYVDLFSGAGGLSLGLELAGHTLLGAVDNDRTACLTFATNHEAMDPVVRADLGDGGESQSAIMELASRSGRDGVDLVAGGPPCQGFSTAGNYRVDDPRNRLVYSFLAAIEALSPRFVLFENVIALSFRRHRHTLTKIRELLDSLGYQSTVLVAHAEGYGLPQLRRRLFVLGTRGGIPSWPTPWRRIVPPTYLEQQPRWPEDAPKPFSVRDGIGDLPLLAASSPDQAVSYARPAQSSLQQWARGDLDIGSFIPEVEPAPATELKLC